MKKLHMLSLALFFCTSALAEQIVIVCEVPAGEGDEGCGPNNTYLTYRFSVETDELNGKFGSTYGYQAARGCDVSKEPKWRYKLSATEEWIRFNRNYGQNDILVNRESMNAVIRSKTASSPEFACRLEEGGSEMWSKGTRKSTQKWSTTKDYAPYR